MEFEITNEDAGDTRETNSVIAELPNGNLLVAWTQFASSQTNGRTSGVRVIEADGTPVSNELFPSGLVPSGDTLNPTILAISDTKFLIVEAVFDQTSFAFTLSGHVLTLSGSILSSGPAIDLTPTGEFSNGGLDLALTDSGKVILATSVTPDGNNPTVEIAVLDDDLAVLTPFTQIGERNTNSPSSINVDTNGETAVVTWTQNNIGNTQTPVLGQTVTIAGDGSIASFTRVDHVLRADDPFGNGLRDTLVLDNGNVVILTNGGPDPEVNALGDGDRLFVTIFNSDLTTVVKATERVDQVDSANGIGGASLTAFDGGGFLVSFSRKPTTAANGFESEIYTRSYDNTYTAVGGENRVTMNDDPNTDDEQYFSDGGPVVAVTSAAGDATIVWTQTRIGTNPFDFGDEELFGIQINNLDPNAPPPNTAPTENNNTGSSLAEGGTDTITTAELDFNDAEQDDTAITYTVTNATDNGAVRLNGSSTTTFTQDDINNNRVTYLHDGGETTSDQLTFAVSDGTETVTGQTFDFTVAPVNDDPTATGIPASVTVEEDVPTLLDLSAIDLSDVDAGSGQLQLVITASEGTLQLGAGAAGSSININSTLAGLNNTLNNATLITYTSALNDNGTPGATLTVTLNDNGNTGSGGGTPVTLGTINVNITAVNDDPTGPGAPASVTVTEDVASDVDLSGITFADVDSGGFNTTFKITASEGTLSAVSAGFVNVSGSGTGELTLTGVASRIDTYLNNASAVQYTSALNANGPATLTLVANDLGNTGTGGGSDVALGSVSVDITAVNDPPVLTGDLTGEVEEAGTYVLVAADVGFTDVDDDATGVSFAVSNQVNGIVLVDGVPGAFFTPAQLLAGSVAFQHDGSEAATASFDIAVDDGNEDFSQRVDSTFNLVVSPVNEGPTFEAVSAVPILTVEGDESFGRFGQQVDGIGDINGDGMDDFIVAAPEEGTSSQGTVRVFSGADGAVLYSYDGETAQDQFGRSVAGAGDINGDGTPDFIIGTDLEDENGDRSGSARVYSGADGSNLYTLFGDFTRDTFGISVDGAGDVNDDGFDDFIVGAQGDDPNFIIDAGTATVFSGMDGSQLYQFNGTGEQDLFGRAVAGVGDVNGDGHDDVIVGAILDFNPPNGGGTATVLSGINGAQLYQFEGLTSSAQFGSEVNSAGDVNADGIPDFIVGAPSSSAGFGFQTGEARVLSGADGSQLYSFLGEAANNQFGVSVSGAGDLNGDGHDDLIVGAHRASDGTQTTGSATIISGADGSTLTTLFGSSASAEFGISVAAAGDVNGDGNPDFIVGAQREDGIVSDGGAAIVYTLIDGSTVNGTPEYTEDGPAVLLDDTIIISDPELDFANGGDGNYDGASFTVARNGGADPEDIFSLAMTPNITVNGNALEADGNSIATVINAAGTLNIVFTDDNGSTPTTALVNEILSAVQYENSSDTPPMTVDIDYTFSDGNGGVQGPGGPLGTTDTLTVAIIPTDDASVAEDDAFSIFEDETLTTSNVFDANPTTADSDVDSAPTVTEVNGEAADVGQQVTLPSGALLTLNANGTFAYDPNGAFDSLSDAASSGASNTTGADSFTYTLVGGDVATVSMTINGVDSEGDVLLGTAAAETLNGGIGGDTMTGLAGDDLYAVDSMGDQVIEAAGEGQDTVYSTVSFTLGDNVETLILQGGLEASGTGNSGNNQIFGNAVANRLDGGGGVDQMAGSGGNDTYVVDSIDDAIFEAAGEGNDTVEASLTWGLGADFENLTLTGNDDINAQGNELANTITGNAGSNNIDGGAGTDIMIGGAGDDIYRVDNSSDLITELAGEGTDAVFASVDYILSAEIEQLSLTGTATSGTGNASNNTLIGNDEVNVLFGGLGTDYLVGGGGNDIFVITKLDGADVEVIADFEGAGVAGGDLIGFAAADFGTDGTVTQVSQTSFIVARVDGTNEQQFILADLAPGNSGLSVDDYYFG